ncbi:MAG: integration host factor subunit beta [Phycisphaerales bacterium]|nr:integration host factor subunit beta [Phycisphaerales bacterium]
MKTITKKALVDQIAQRTGHKRVVAKQIIQEFLDQVIDEIAEGNRLEFRDFGVFEVKHRAPRMAQNPKTLERVPVPAKRTVKFKAGRRMRECLEAPETTTESTPKTEQQETSTVVASARSAEPKPQVHVNTGNAPAIIGSITREEAVANS